MPLFSLKRKASGIEDSDPKPLVVKKSRFFFHRTPSVVSQPLPVVETVSVTQAVPVSEAVPIVQTVPVVQEVPVVQQEPATSVPPQQPDQTLVKTAPGRFARFRPRFPRLRRSTSMFFTRCIRRPGKKTTPSAPVETVDGPEDQPVEMVDRDPSQKIKKPKSILCRTPSLSTKPSLSLHTINSMNSFHGDIPSSDELPPPRPVRRRSVRFQGVDEHQLDGSPGEHRDSVTGIKPEGEWQDKLERRLSRRLMDLDGEPSTQNGDDTILHRSSLRARPTVPFVDMLPGIDKRVISSKPSSRSSSRASSRLTSSSPVSTASTGATSLPSMHSPRSTGSNKRQTPEDTHNNGKAAPAGEHREENCLPPIEENSGRYLFIPVQEVPIEKEPSIITVEATAAAKSYLEIFYSNLLPETVSPRSMRRRRFEKDLDALGLTHDKRSVARQEWLQAESESLRQYRALKSSSIARHTTKGVSIAGFSAVRVLGKGSFGIVRLVTDSQTSGQENEQTSSGRSSCYASDMCDTDGTVHRPLPSGQPLKDVFAMKVIRKSAMLRGCQEGHLRAERDFLVNAEGSRWVVPLIASFQDNSSLYLVMEYMIGGDFLGLLLRFDVLDEATAR